MCVKEVLFPHSSDLIQLKLNLRVTNLSLRAPTCPGSPLPAVCALPIDAVSPTASSTAPGCRLTGCQWASLRSSGGCPDAHSPILCPRGATPYTRHSAG